MAKESLMASGILLVAAGEDFQKVLDLNFKTFLNVDIDIVSTGFEAIRKLKEGEKFKLIIAVSEIGGEKTLSQISEQLVSLGSSIPMISLGDDPKTVMKRSELDIQVVHEIDDVRELIKKTAGILGITAKDMANIPTSSHYPIPIDHFHTLSESPADVYIKIGKGDKSQYIKRIHEGEGLEEEIIERYKRNGVQDLYIESEKRLAFVNSLTETILSVLDNQQSSTDEVIKATEVAQETIKKNIETLGITPEIAQMSDKAINRMMSEAAKYPRMNKLLQNMMANKSSFSFKHTQLTSYMSMMILKKMDWAKKEQIKTLSFVSFFHDICLTNDKLTEIHNTQELREANLNKNDMELVKKHAQKASELVHHYPNLPMGADNIIRQHHGVLNGVGFSEGFSGQLSPLAVIFIVAEECAHLVLKTEFEQLNKRKIIYELEQKYTTSRFKKMIEALEEIM